MLPTDNLKSVRKISSKDEFNNLLEKPVKSLDVDGNLSKKDRLEKLQSLINDEQESLPFLFSVGKYLSELDDKNSQEKKIYSNVIKSIALEYSAVFHVDAEEAENFISNFFEGEKR